MCPAKLFIIAGGELLSEEGRTQGDPTSMGVYTLGILSLLQFLLDFISVNESTPKRLLLKITLRLLANHQALKTTGAK